MPHDNASEIQCVAFTREELQTELARYFGDQDALHFNATVGLPVIDQPSSNTLVAVYLADDHRGPTYNNRASELVGTNISHNYLLLELDIETGTFTTNTEVLRTTIAELCNDARDEGLIATIYRSVKTSVSETALGKFFEGFASTS